MGRRIEVELTSTKEDGSWTWRAAGAKQPKGAFPGSLLHDGAKVGDVIKVEAEFHLDGIEITEVFAPRQKRERTDLLEMKSRPLRDDELVTTQRVSRNDKRGDRRGGRGRARGERRDGEHRGGRGPRTEAERRPKPKRLRPRRVHRDALLAEVTEEHRPIVDQVMRDGMPGVRAAIEKQNAEAKAAGKPEVDPNPILVIAEKNLGAARLADWRDRADAALADGQELDIRDLRSVVVAGADVARDDASRALVDQVKTLLDQRLESDHATWLQDLDSAVTEDRVVRGLRLSSRPVKAGAPLPTEVAARLAEQASEALAADVAQDRWATVLDALAFSPVRGAVTPAGIPPAPSEELLAEVRRLSDRVPAIANLFGIDPATVPKSAKRRRSPRRDGGNRNRKGQRRDGGPAGGQNGGRGRSQDGTRNRPVPGANPTPAPNEPTPAADAPAEPQAAEGETPAVSAPQAESPEPQVTPQPSSESKPAETPAKTDAPADTGTEAPAEAGNTDAPAEDAQPATDADSAPLAVNGGQETTSETGTEASAADPGSSETTPAQTATDDNQTDGEPGAGSAPTADPEPSTA